MLINTTAGACYKSDNTLLDKRLDIETIPTKIEARINELPKTQSGEKYNLTGVAIIVQL